ncbi:MAG: hypothetical protein ACJ8AW_09130 [Rhodopila sp.]
MLTNFEPPAAERDIAAKSCAAIPGSNLLRFGNQQADVVPIDLLKHDVLVLL